MIESPPLIIGPLMLVESVVREVKKVLGGTAKVHVFGISMSALRRVYSIISSYDTSAWVYWAKVDGAVLIWSRKRKAFVHLQARSGYRYPTEVLMEINLRNLIEMHTELCQTILQSLFHSK